MVLLRILQYNFSFSLEIILLFTLIHAEIRTTRTEDCCWDEIELILPLICTNSGSSLRAWLLPLLSQRQEMAALGDEFEHSAEVPAAHCSGKGHPPPSLGSQFLTPLTLCATASPPSQWRISPQLLMLTYSPSVWAILPGPIWILEGC